MNKGPKYEVAHFSRIECTGELPPSFPLLRVNFEGNSSGTFEHSEVWATFLLFDSWDRPHQFYVESKHILV